METVEISRSEYARLKREAELRMEDANEAIRVRRRLVQAENCIHGMLETISGQQIYRYTAEVADPHDRPPHQVKIIQADDGELLSFADVKWQLENEYDYYLELQEKQ